MANVQKHLQSPVVRSLRSIVDIIKPTGYGINKIIRHRSVPINRSKHAVAGSNGASVTAPGSSGKNGALETVSEEMAVGPEHSQLSIQRRSNTQNERIGTTTQADGQDANLTSGL